MQYCPAVGRGNRLFLTNIPRVFTQHLALEKYPFGYCCIEPAGPCRRHLGLIGLRPLDCRKRGRADVFRRRSQGELSESHDWVVLHSQAESYAMIELLRDVLNRRVGERAIVTG